MVVADADSMNGLLQASRGQVERRRRKKKTSTQSRERKKEREEETEPKQCAMSAIEDMYPVVCFDSKSQFHNDIIPVTAHIRLFFAMDV